MNINTPRELSEKKISKENVKEALEHFRTSIIEQLGLDASKADTLIEYLEKSPTINKKEIASEVQLVKSQVEEILNLLKKGWNGDDYILIKPKSLMESSNEVGKYYYNKFAKELYNQEVEKFFMDTSATYRKYTLEKIAEFMQGKSQNNYSDSWESIKSLAGIIEFPADYIEMIIAYLEKYNFVTFDSGYNISLTEKWKKYFTLLSHVHFQNNFLEIDENRMLTTVIIDIIKNDPSVSEADIQAEILSLMWCQVNPEDLKLFRKEMLNNLKKWDPKTLYDLNFLELKTMKKYKIENGSYIFEFKKDDFKGEKVTETAMVAVSKIDEIFFQYSSRGANLTQKQIIEELHIDENIWGIMKSRLGLTKNSDIASPYTIEMFRGDDKMREEYMSRAWQNYQKYRMRIGERKYEKQELSKMRNNLEKIFSTHEGFLNYLSKTIQQYKPKKLEKMFEQTENKNQSELTISFSDIHFGKTETHKIINRLRKIAEDVTNSPETKINIICLGDLAEAIVEGGMHTGQKEKMDWANKDTFEIIMEITDILQNFLITLYRSGKQVDFYGIGGNHDRIGENHNQDMARTGALVIYELTKRGLLSYKDTENMKIDYSKEKWSQIERDGFHYILHHGDDGATNKGKNKLESILWQLWDQKKENIVLMGDKHNLQMSNPVEGGTFVQVPALAGKWEYDSRLLLSSSPWYVFITKNSEEKPDIWVRFLH